MINHYHPQSVNLVEWPTQQSAAAAAGLTLSTAPSLETDLLGSKNIFLLKPAYESGFAALTALDLQILAEGIELDHELIAECRSGEI